MKKIVLGVVSQTGAGKDTLAEFLTEKGYLSFSLSDTLRAYARKIGESTDKENLQNLGNKLRKEMGADILARMVSEIPEFKTTEKGIVVTGIRHPSEIAFFKEGFGARIIGLKASQRTRFEFSIGRNREGDPKTFAEFVRLDERELKDEKNLSAMQVDECLRESDIVIYNEKRGTTKEQSLDYFRKNTEMALRELGLEYPKIKNERG